jgi:membrane-associated phospholipid phosphatase
MLAATLLGAVALRADAGGIDQQAPPGADTGIWSRHNQILLQDLTAIAVVGGALWEGDGSRIGHTTWQSLDAVIAGGVTAALMKITFSRARPSQTSDPGLWFQGSGHNSFPSAEVMEITTAITPFVLEYSDEHPAVWALELLPVYDGIARVKSRGHWQTDVLASLAIGTAIGANMHVRPDSIMVGLLPHGFSVGWKTRF